MSSLIHGIIPERNFELVRNKIISIITDEFANQYILTSNVLFQVGIYKERFIAFDKTELPAILVYFSRFDFDGKIPQQSEGDAIFSIEVHTNAKFTSSQRGDTQASLDCDFLIGKLQYIFSNPYYQILDMSDKKIIRTVNVDSIQIGRSNVDGDGLANVVGLITLRVRMLENNGAITGITYEGSDTILNDNFKITINS